MQSMRYRLQWELPRLDPMISVYACIGADSLISVCHHLMELVRINHIPSWWFPRKAPATGDPRLWLEVVVALVNRTISGQSQTGSFWGTHSERTRR